MFGYFFLDKLWFFSRGQLFMVGAGFVQFLRPFFFATFWFLALFAGYPLIHLTD
jgi:hypothetical protein